MIEGFTDPETERFFRDGKAPPEWRALAAVARRKLDMLDYARRVEDLAAPPGNRLERLKGDRTAQGSIRVNERWRLCYRWPDGGAGPSDVEIVDYHR